MLQYTPCSRSPPKCCYSPGCMDFSLILHHIYKAWQVECMAYSLAKELLNRITHSGSKLKHIVLLSWVYAGLCSALIQFWGCSNGFHFTAPLFIMCNCPTICVHIPQQPHIISPIATYSHLHNVYDFSHTQVHTHTHSWQPPNGDSHTVLLTPNWSLSMIFTATWSQVG